MHDVEDGLADLLAVGVGRDDRERLVLPLLELIADGDDGGLRDLVGLLRNAIADLIVRHPDVGRELHLGAGGEFDVQHLALTALLHQRDCAQHDEDGGEREEVGDLAHPIDLGVHDLIPLRVRQRQAPQFAHAVLVDHDPEDRASDE